MDTDPMNESLAPASEVAYVEKSFDFASARSQEEIWALPSRRGEHPRVAADREARLAYEKKKKKKKFFSFIKLS